MFDNGNPLSPDKIRELNNVKRLLKPKFLQMLDYPDADANHQAGKILFPVSKEREEKYRKFPGVFREMQWWEELPFEELPKYLKPNTSDKTINQIYKVQRFASHGNIINGVVYVEGSDFAVTSRSYIPATEWEYVNYMKNLGKEVSDGQEC